MSQDLKADKYFNQRRSMVENQIKGIGISNKNVLNALMSVPRHKFVHEEDQGYSYDDRPLLIGYD